jgi:hypothetical protein
MASASCWCSNNSSQVRPNAVGLTTLTMVVGAALTAIPVGEWIYCYHSHSLTLEAGAEVQTHSVDLPSTSWILHS